MSRLYGLILMGLLASVVTADAFASSSPATPIRDDVYLQEVGRKIPTDTPVLSVAVIGDKIVAGFDDGLCLLKGDTLVPWEGPREKILRLFVIDGVLYVSTENAFHRCKDGAWSKLHDAPVNDMCSHLGNLVVAAKDGLMLLQGDALLAVPNGRAVERIASYSESLYCLVSGRLAIFDGHDFDADNVMDWGALPSTVTRDLFSFGNQLLVATDRGLGQLRGMAMTAIQGPQGLCYDDTTCLSPGFEGDYWVGTSRGAIRAVRGEFQFFGADRWLPGNVVNDIVCGDKVAYIATDKGLGIIEYEPYTLLKKAAYYERHMEEWGQKRLGFTYKLEWHADKGGWLREISDNDGGWSADYLAAMAFKYAMTKDEQVKAEAKNTFDSLRWLVQITGIPGFPARAIYCTKESVIKAMHGSGGLPAEWHATPDGNWEWKGDTSSDETDFHFYAVSLFHDIAANDEEKRQAVDHIRAIGNHVVDNGWILRDYDGKPTRWGRWDLEYLQTPYGYYARGLNGMEALCYIRTASALSGDRKFDDAYALLQKWGYPREVLRQKLTFPHGYIFHSDDRMAFVMYYTLLRYEKDPEMRSIYMRSLERSWEVERIEHSPFFNFIYGALTGNECEAEEAVKHLREWPLDLVSHSYHNSHRSDIVTPAGYAVYADGVKPLSPRERGPHRWTDSTLDLDGGSDGREVVDPASWLEAYWMGRFHGFIPPPDTDAPALTTVELRNERFGAAPYDGPPRPSLSN